MHRQLYSADDFTERTIAAVLRDATVAKDDCTRCVGPALLGGYDDRFRLLPDDAPGARLAQRLLRDGVTCINTLYRMIGARPNDAIIGLATVAANSATYLTPALIDAVIRTADGLGPWLATVLESDPEDSGLTTDAWEALGAAAISRLCDDVDETSPGSRAERDGAAAILLQLTASGEASHRWPRWRERLFVECDHNGPAGCRDAAAVLMAGGLTFAPLTAAEYLRLMPALARYAGWMTSILRHPLLDDSAVAAGVAVFLVGSAMRHAEQSGIDAPDAESCRVMLCDRHLRLASDHPVVLAVDEWFASHRSEAGPSAAKPTALTRRRSRRVKPVQFFSG
ncbi:MAG: hypothetical protein V4813_19595 [Gemmatimonadota bacterium]